MLIAKKSIIAPPEISLAQEAPASCDESCLPAPPAKRKKKDKSSSEAVQLSGKEAAEVPSQPVPRTEAHPDPPARCKKDKNSSEVAPLSEKAAQVPSEPAQSSGGNKKEGLVGLECISRLVSLYYADKVRAPPPPNDAYKQKLLDLVNKLICESQVRARQNNRKNPAAYDL